VAIVPIQDDLINQASAVRLARYAKIVDYPECNFFGVNQDTGVDVGQCREFWVKSQRDMILKYLAEAQYEIEQIAGYPMAPTYIGESQPDEYQDWQPFRRKIVTKFARFIEAGIEATADISLGEAVNHATDPAVIGPVATTVTDTSEVRVYHPGLDVEIDPSSVVIAGGNLTIQIPRCRMVTEANADNPKTGLTYTDLTNFESTVDIKRTFTNTATQATLAYPRTCTGCTEQTISGCFYVRDPRVGVLDIQLSANGNNLCSCSPEIIRLNYLAGADVLTRQAEDAIVRLAHSKMSSEPCGCQVVQRLWGEDRNTPEVLTAERLNCPFGLSNGAWVAFQFAQALKVYRSSNL
jgi:hypothetical protein